MPLGLVTPEQFELEIKEIVHGRNGAKAVPMEIRKVVAEELISGGSLEDVSKAFGISKSSASAYKNGATSTSTYHEPNDDLKKSNDAIIDSIVSPARQKLIEVINTIDLTGKIKPRDAAGIAQSLSTVIKNTLPQDAAVHINQNKVVIFKPRMKEEDDYEVITVNE